MSTWNVATRSATTHAGLHAAGCAIALSVVLAFYHFVYSPLRQDISAHSEQIAKIRTLSVHSERVALTNRSLGRRLAEITKAAQSVRERMPVEVSASNFVELASQLAAALDVEVEQCQADPPQHYPGHSTIDVTCKLAGSYASICQYLVTIDQLPQISRILRFELLRTTNAEGYPVHVTFQLYYRAQPNDKDRQRGTL